MTLNAISGTLFKIRFIRLNLNISQQTQHNYKPCNYPLGNNPKKSTYLRKIHTFELGMPK